MSSLAPRRQYGMRPANSFYDMMDEFFGAPLTAGFGSNAGLSSLGSLGSGFKMDVHETDENYVVEADMPGVSRDEIELELNEGRLNISVNKQVEEDNSEKNYLHRERLSYSASRGIYLKDAITEGVSASLADGVLTVTVPKKSQTDHVTKIQID